MNPSNQNEISQLYYILFKVKNICESIDGDKKCQFDTVFIKNLIQTELSYMFSTSLPWLWKRSKDVAHRNAKVDNPSRIKGILSATYMANTAETFQASIWSIWIKSPPFFIIGDRMLRPCFYNKR